MTSSGPSWSKAVSSLSQDDQSPNSDRPRSPWSWSPATAGCAGASWSARAASGSTRCRHRGRGEQVVEINGRFTPGLTRTQAGRRQVTLPAAAMTAQAERPAELGVCKSRASGAGDIRVWRY
jgi:hypothetical protein